MPVGDMNGTAMFVAKPPKDEDHVALETGEVAKAIMHEKRMFSLHTDKKGTFDEHTVTCGLYNSKGFGKVEWVTIVQTLGHDEYDLLLVDDRKTLYLRTNTADGQKLVLYSFDTENGAVTMVNDNLAQPTTTKEPKMEETKPPLPLNMRIFVKTINLSTYEFCIIAVYQTGDKHTVTTEMTKDGTTTEAERVVIEPYHKYEAIYDKTHNRIYLKCLLSTEEEVRRITYGVLPFGIVGNIVDKSIPFSVFEAKLDNIADFSVPFDIEVINNPVPIVESTRLTAEQIAELSRPLPPPPTKEEPVKQENKTSFNHTTIEKHINGVIYKLEVEELDDGAANMRMMVYRQAPLIPSNNIWTSEITTFMSDGYVMDVNSDGNIKVHGVTPGIDRTDRFVWSPTGILMSVVGNRRG